MAELLAGDPDVFRFAANRAEIPGETAEFGFDELVDNANGEVEEPLGVYGTWSNVKRLFPVDGVGVENGESLTLSGERPGGERPIREFTELPKKLVVGAGGDKQTTTPLSELDELVLSSR